MENSIINYDIDYFLDKFSNIPDENWTTGELKEKGTNKYCAFGHCDITTLTLKDINNNREASALVNIIGNMWDVVYINDGTDKYANLHYSHLGATPKERIINSLKEIKSQNEQNQQSDIIRDVI